MLDLWVVIGILCQILTKRKVQGKHDCKVPGAEFTPQALFKDEPTCCALFMLLNAQATEMNNFRNDSGACCVRCYRQFLVLTLVHQ